MPDVEIEWEAAVKTNNGEKGNANVDASGVSELSKNTRETDSADVDKNAEAIEDDVDEIEITLSADGEPEDSSSADPSSSVFHEEVSQTLESLASRRAFANKYGIEFESYCGLYYLDTVLVPKRDYRKQRAA